jgi:probable HAF family extracellular repeat protein
MRSRHCAFLAVLLSVSAASAAFAAASLTPLGDLPGAPFSSSAYGVSADGSVIVGWGASASGYEAFRWTSEGGMVGLGTTLPDSDSVSFAKGVSGDGSVVVGYSQIWGPGHASASSRSPSRAGSALAIPRADRNFSFAGDVFDGERHGRFGRLASTIGCRTV